MSLVGAVGGIYKIPTVNIYIFDVDVGMRVIEDVGYLCGTFNGKNTTRSMKLNCLLRDSYLLRNQIEMNEYKT